MEKKGDDKMGKIKKLRYTNMILSMFVVVFVVSAVAMIGTAAACHYDWGDAPDPYPTLTGNNGANHGDGNYGRGYYLGDKWDHEDDGQPDSEATGDDNSSNDDEDGVIFGPLTAGNLATVQVTVIAPLSKTGYLNAWIDFNADGDWADSGEQIFTDVPLTPEHNELTFDVPQGATTGTTFARFRFCSGSGMCSFYEGNAPDGEVEDYMVNIENTEIPEFSTIALPVAAILGLMFFFNHRKRRRD
ncbi:hypothetical protein C5S39_02575 [Candidatus Methanophagaceae archaeon]|jgi:hypothetical protein|nr:hypothetical protein C5S39_02575 [Methanophagales archaeon]